MIEWVHGDIFDSQCIALVNPVNCVGVMGKGLALQFKKEFPENFLAYQEACKQRTIGIGKLFIFEENEHIIINFPTKRHWRDPSRLSYIDLGLKDLLKYNFKSIALPPLGCGLGGLQWFDIRRLIYNKLEDYPGNVEVYYPMEDI